MAYGKRKFRLSLKIGRVLMSLPDDKPGIPFKELDEDAQVNRLLHKAYELTSGTTYDKQVFIQNWPENEKYI